MTREQLINWIRSHGYTAEEQYNGIKVPIPYSRNGSPINGYYIVNSVREAKDAIGLKLAAMLVLGLFSFDVMAGDMCTHNVCGKDEQELQERCKEIGESPCVPFTLDTDSKNPNLTTLEMDKVNVDQYLEAYFNRHPERLHDKPCDDAACKEIRTARR